VESFWDQRFSEEGLAYGREPNAFLKQQLGRLTPGSLLLPAEGEGRNAVWAAVEGWRVHAFDTSTVGRDKALEMAERRGVEIAYEVRSAAADLRDFEGRFDAVGLVFMHLPPDVRRVAHRAAARSLRPGGTLILEAFSKAQLELGTGGPRHLDLLYETDDLESDFSGLSISSLARVEVELDEGRYHRGLSSVIRLVAEARSA
jgi:SAM-dependent methyltransferase